MNPVAPVTRARLICRMIQASAYPPLSGIDLFGPGSPNYRTIENRQKGHSHRPKSWGRLYVCQNHSHWDNPKESRKLAVHAKKCVRLAGKLRSCVKFALDPPCRPGPWEGRPGGI